MQAQRQKFVDGATTRGIGAKKATKIFDLMEHFAGYGFNKSHSAAYALLAFHTAYLKTHFPVEFMAALLTSVTGSTDDVVKYIKECREMEIAVEPPDINVSDANFTPHGEAIRFGLAAVKNVGRNAIDSIVEARTKKGRFASIFEFCENVDLRLLNKRVLESLVKSGAMDGFGDSFGRRAQVMASLDKAIELSQKAQRDAESGQHGLFGVFEPEHNAVERLPNTPDWDEHTRLSYEKEILGFFITGHPLEKYADKLADFNAKTAEEVLTMKSTPKGVDEIYVGGILTGVRAAKSRKGEMYAQGGLEDMTGKVAEEGSNAKLTPSEIIPLEEATPKLARALRIRIPLETATPATVDALHVLFGEKKGAAKVLFDVERAGDFMAVMEAEGYNVLPDRYFMSRVEELCGRGSVRVID